MSKSTTSPIRPLEIRWQGHLLPYRVFNKDQRVSPAAIVENKRLRHALSVVKVQQDRRSAVKIMTNSEKIGYKKRPDRVYGTVYEVQTAKKRLVLTNESW